MTFKTLTHLGLFLIILLSAGCVRAAGAAVGVAAATAKTGVKATGAVVDAATPDGGDHDDDHHHSGDDPRPFDATRNASYDVDAALAASQYSGRNVLLVLGGNWCHDSRGLAAKFERSELSDIIEENYELVWVDVGRHNRNLHIAERFGVNKLYGTPTILILSSEERLLNADSVHDWRAADSAPYEDVVAYFQSFAPRAQ